MPCASGSACDDLPLGGRKRSSRPQASGSSRRPPTAGGRWTARLLLELAQAIGLEPLPLHAEGVVGHSLGGWALRRVGSRPSPGRRRWSGECWSRPGPAERSPRARSGMSEGDLGGLLVTPWQNPTGARAVEKDEARSVARAGEAHKGTAGSGGERAGARRGGSAGMPRWKRILRITSGSAMSAIRRRRDPQCAQRSTSTSNTRRMSSAHE